MSNGQKTREIEEKNDEENNNNPAPHKRKREIRQGQGQKKKKTFQKLYIFLLMHTTKHTKDRFVSVHFSGIFLFFYFSWTKLKKKDKPTEFLVESEISIKMRTIDNDIDRKRAKDKKNGRTEQKNTGWFMDNEI